MSACLYVCLFVCLSASISPKLHARSSLKLCACCLLSIVFSFNGGVEICYVLPVLWMSSHFPIMGHMAPCCLVLANVPAASYWLCRVLTDGGRRDQTSHSWKGWRGRGLYYNSALLWLHFVCTGWAKRRGHRLMIVILSNLNRFAFFTVRFLYKFAVEWILNVSPHLAYVATLHCETSVSAKQAINDKLQGNVATYVWCGGIVNK